MLADAQAEAAQIIAKAEKSAAATVKEAEARGAKIIRDQEEQAKASAKSVRQQVRVDIHRKLVLLASCCDNDHNSLAWSPC